MDFLASQLGVDASLLAQYGRRIDTRNQHVQEVETYLGYQTALEEDLLQLGDWLVDRALEHNNPTLLMGLAAEKLKQTNLIRPGITRLARVVASARDKAQTETYRLLAPLLSDERKVLLDELVKVERELGLSRLEWLRQEADKVSPRALIANLNKLEWLRLKGVNQWQWQIPQFNPNRRKYLAQQARKSTTCPRTSQSHPTLPDLVGFCR